MYCQYCGSELPEGTKFCTNCGKPVGVAGQDSWQQKADKAAAAMGSFADEAMDTLNSAGKAVDSAISDIESEFRGGTTYYGAPLKERFAYELEFRMRSFLHQIEVETILVPALKEIPWEEMREYPESFLFGNCDKRTQITDVICEKVLTEPRR